MKNNWTEERKPNNMCPYNHIILDTPLGKAVIDWKGWKENPIFELSIGGDWITNSDCLEDVKEYLEIYLIKMRDNLNDFLKE